MLVHSERRQQREEDTRPGGLLWFLPWNNNQYVATATFVTTVYSIYLDDIKASISCPRGAAHPSHLIASAKSQVIYMRINLTS